MPWLRKYRTYQELQAMDTPAGFEEECTTEDDNNDSLKETPDRRPTRRESTGWNMALEEENRILRERVAFLNDQISKLDATNMERRRSSIQK